MSVQLDDTAICINCGYCLQGLAEHRCPECGRRFDPGNAKTYLRASANARLLATSWLWAAVIPAVSCLAAPIIFALLLSKQGYRVHDLWNSSSPLSGIQATPAGKFVQPATLLANGCLWLSALTFLYCAALAVVARVRDDSRTAAIAATCMIVCVISGSLAFGLGSIIAGK